MATCSLKTCSKCGEKKSLNEFTFRKDSNTYRNECKSCLNKYANKYRINNRDTILINLREYYYKNRDKLKMRMHDYYLNNKDIFLELNRKSQKKTKTRKH